MEQKSIPITGGDPDEVFPGIPVPADFDRAVGDYIEAADLEKIGVALIEKRECFAPLRDDCAVAYLWQRKGGTSAGKPVFGRCRRPRGLLAKYCAADFIVTVSADYAAAAHLTRFQVEALIFHELNHATIDAQKGAGIRPHDYEGFTVEVDFYGAWHPDLERAAASFKQLSLL